MSRSYREPWAIEGYGTKRKRWMKRYANRAVRNAVDVPSGMAYRRFYDPYFISDYRWMWDPRPRYFWRNGVMDSYDDGPEWRARRK